MILKFTKVATVVCIAFLGNPYSALSQTITFSQDDAINWSDGIAQDGDGGSLNVSGVDLQIYEGASRTSNVQMPGSTIIWEDASWFGSGNGFNGITAGPDMAVTLAGMPSFIIKSTSQAVNFNLTSIQLLDWGLVPAKMEAYDNGVLKGSLSLNLPANGNSETFTALNGLVASTFGDIDEIRIISLNASDPVMWVGLNNLTVAGIPLAIDFINVNAVLNKDKTVSLAWQTGSTLNTQSFEIEKSEDGKSFESIGTIHNDIKGKTQFHFIASSMSASSYFRIKETDDAGSITYSKVVWVQMQDFQQSTILYPNPAKGNLTVQSENDISMVRIFDLSGKEVYSATPGSKHVFVNTSAFSKGMYVIKIRDVAGNEKSDRFMKQ